MMKIVKAKKVEVELEDGSKAIIWCGGEVFQVFDRRYDRYKTYLVPPAQILKTMYKSIDIKDEL